MLLLTNDRIRRVRCSELPKPPSLRRVQKPLCDFASDAMLVVTTLFSCKCGVWNREIQDNVRCLGRSATFSVVSNKFGAKGGG